MGLFSFLKRSIAAAPAKAGGDAAQAVEAARTRARRRLIGAVLLLGIGVIAFPLLFETQPRPIPVDIAIEIPRKEGAPPLAVPPARPTPAAKPAPAPPVPVEMKPEAGTTAPPSAAPAAAVLPKVVEPKLAAAAPAPAPVPVPVPVPVPAATPTPPAAEAKPTAESAARFVVQVGAFADAALARDARAKVEKLGLHTYTQAVDTDNGRRIRVRLGPFPSRDDAENAAAKVKAAGLPAAVLTL